MEEKEKNNKAALYLLQFYNNQINYFSSLLNKYKELDDWTIVEYAMAVKLNRICVEEIEKWIEEQKFNYND